jgi:hypothetical protein
LLVGTASAQQILTYGSITGKVLDKDTGRPLNFANVVIVGTTMGHMARDVGCFNLNPVPVGTYSIKASFVGYEPQTLTEVRVDAGKPTTLEFRLVKGVTGMVKTVIVHCGTRVGIQRAGLAHVTTHRPGGDGALAPPRRTALHANVPNPFNPATDIAFDLTRDGRVELEVYDVSGRLVRSLVNGPRRAGMRQVVSWDGLDGAGSRVASGVYFYRLVAGDFVATRKMVMLK